MADRKVWDKNKSGRGYKRNSRDPLPRILIVCEGQTEQLYFKSFQVYTATVEAFSKGATSLALVEAAIRLSKREKYEEVWCVFDFDVNPLIVDQRQNFNQAINNATQKGIKCAYSNDSFELWFILHYKYTEQQHTRREYNRKLGQMWEINYDDDGKKKKFANEIYLRLESDPNACQNQAISRAKRLFVNQEYKEFYLQNPVTTVFQLVEVLNTHLRR